MYLNIKNQEDNFNEILFLVLLCSCFENLEENTKLQILNRNDEWCEEK